MTESQKQQKIAVLGGGIASLTTVFEITNQPSWQEKYDITVYQMGWRLGGKGASGRNPKISNRIEEHGLHVFLGFYENTFQVIRQCYQELNRSSERPLATWKDAFKPTNFVAFQESVNNQLVTWPYDFPDNAALPGDGDEFPDVWGYICLLVKFLVAQMNSSSISQTTLIDDDEEFTFEDIPDTIKDLLKEINLKPDSSYPVREIAFLQIAHQLVQILPDDPRKHRPIDHYALLWFLGQFKQWFWNTTEAILMEHHKFRRLWIFIDLAYTVISGIIADDLLLTGFDAIDDYDLREWLSKHGASNISADSVMIRGLYDFVFGYKDGDVNKPNFAAGVGLRCWLRMTLSYRGAFAWKMQAGMGDTIFAPLYEVLKQRGVKFKFFHRVKNLELSEDGKNIAQIQIGRQVALKNDDYQPLVDIQGLSCWPSTPLYDQLVEGDTLQAKEINLESAWSPWGDVEEFSLKLGQDFDLVLLGIPVGALKYICPELIATRPQWRDMVENIKTIQTQALQIWLYPNLLELGWSLPSPLLDGYEHPYNTWADMTHLQPQESWSADEQPGHIAYFCGPMEDPDVIPAFNDYGFPEREAQRVHTIALNWFKNHIDGLWPKLKTSQTQLEPNWNLLIDSNKGRGVERFTSQYIRANTAPSERYVLSVKGSTKYRLKVDESGLENLYLTGDWTRNGINVGCIEATVISGRQASRAISGYPLVIPGESDI